MKPTQLFAAGVLTSALLTASMGQIPPSQFDFAHPPKHTVQVKLSEISGRPDSMRLRGYYLFRDGDQFVLLSHRPDVEGQTFIGSVFSDRGDITAPAVIHATGTDAATVNDNRMHWNLHTQWAQENGVTFRASGAHYVVINLNDDPKYGHLPAIFVGHDAIKRQSGSGYVMIDMLK